MGYIYRLSVIYRGAIFKTFLGNDINILKERFEMWAIKQSEDRNEMETRVDFVQHSNNK